MPPIKVVWNRNEFDEWRETKSGEALAQLLDRDRELATRLQVQESIQKSLAVKQLITGTACNAMAVVDATVVPVYANLEEYQRSLREDRANADVVEIVASQLPMPADDEELKRRVDLRSRESFKAFMPSFTKWQEKVILRLLQAGEDEVIRRHEIRLATLELREAIEQFQRPVKDAQFNRVAKGLTMSLVVGSALIGHVGPLFAGLMEHGPVLFNIRSLVQPWWRPLLNEEFAVAGVICEAATR